ncbi:MAG: 4Fe-4S dicluster domain-containing protein [Phycisphaerae bacterium]|nr:4Fe-4S dicluster domain-containing protein [Phycisphaerae bacterium]
MSGTRRDFLRTAGVLGLGGAIVNQPASALASEGPKLSDELMGVLVDITKCIGCRRCEFACKEATQKAAEVRADGPCKEGDLFKPQPLETYEDKSVFDSDGLRRPEPHCHTRISRFPNPQDETKPVYAKYNCLHCVDPSCMSACIVGAFRKLPEGPVLYDAWKCMGCRYCMVACPFGIPQYEYDNLLTPQVRKCTMCADEGNLMDPTLPEDHPNKGKVPACVKICPAEVMTYGKRSELLELAHETIHKHPEVYHDHVYGEHEVGGTSWLYLAPRDLPHEELGFLKLEATAPPRLTESIQHGVFKYFVPPVAWYGLLGAMMWITKPNPGQEEHAPGDCHH